MLGAAAMRGPHVWGAGGASRPGGAYPPSGPAGTSRRSRPQSYRKSPERGAGRALGRGGGTPRTRRPSWRSLVPPASPQPHPALCAPGGGAAGQQRPPGPSTRVPTSSRGASGWGAAAGTHHSDGRVELRDAHPAGGVLAVEALVGDGAARGPLHRRLRRVRVQVDELLPWAGGSVSGPPGKTQPLGRPGRGRGPRGGRHRRWGWGSVGGCRDEPWGAPLTHVADEVVGAVRLPSDHSQGLGHREAALRGEAAGVSAHPRTGQRGRLTPPAHTGTRHSVAGRRR